MNFRFVSRPVRDAGLLLITALALLALAAPANAAFPGKNGKIAFVCGGSICTVNPDSTAPETLSGPLGSGAYSTPQWSPDGQKIAFASETAPNPIGCGYDNIFVMNADGTGQVNLTHDSCSDRGQPTWSSDQTKIAFSSPQLYHRDRISPNLFDIYVMSADGTGVTKLTDAGTILGAPACGQLTCVHFGVDVPRWSPDGAKIAFDAEGQIDTINADGSQVSSLTGSSTGGPSWSPDGQRIAFTKLTSFDINTGVFNDDIYTINRDGSGITKLTNTPSDEQGPAWSPDGRKIVFTSTGPPAGLYVMNADGSGATFLTAGREPDWQPLPGPKRSDYNNAAKFCKAERDFLGDAAFATNYGGGSNAYGKCVSANH